MSAAHTHLQVLQGDITEVTTDAVVNAANQFVEICRQTSLASAPRAPCTGWGDA